MRTIFFVLNIVLLCFCALTLSWLFKNSSKYRDYDKHEVIILEEDSFIVLAGIPQTFKIDEVEAVDLTEESAEANRRLENSVSVFVLDSCVMVWIY